ncbi:MAG: zinc ABC transporter substrate-binding protein [Deferribacteraceae bacterium]|jgi:zinc transport system substrate-binding protein|nr:zinc ABC transporter substrate-binding protein [Deferribacteraceae bacterium]
MKNLFLTAVILFFVILFFPLAEFLLPYRGAPHSAAAYAREITVTVSIPPQKYIIDRISGGKINVNVMAPKGSDPHIFSPKAAQIKQLADSALYLAIGFPFEDSMIPQISKSFKNLPVIKTQNGITILSEDEGYIQATRSDEKKTEKTHWHSDPHIWTSPKEMATIAENTFKTLVNADPINRGIYEKNYAALLEDIRTADRKFTDLFSNPRISKKFLVYHPAWSYFARHYDLEQYAVEIDGKPPKAKDLKNIIEKAKTENISIFLIQPQLSASAVNNVTKELGIKAVSIDILGEDWLAVMSQMYSAFSGVF